MKWRLATEDKILEEDEFLDWTGGLSIRSVLCLFLCFPLFPSALCWR